MLAGNVADAEGGEIDPGRMHVEPEGELRHASRSMRFSLRQCAQLHLADLAGRRERKPLDRVDHRRHLEFGDARGTQRLQLGGRHGPGELHRRADDLAVIVIRHAEHRHLGHGIMLLQHVLDLGGIDVLAAADDHVAQPAAGDDQAAILAQVAQVAGAQPAVDDDGFRRGLGLACNSPPSPSAPGPGSRRSRPAAGAPASRGCDDAQLVVGQRPARRLPAQRIVMLRAGEQRAALGLAIDLRRPGIGNSAAQRCSTSGLQSAPPQLPALRLVRS